MRALDTSVLARFFVDDGDDAGFDAMQAVWRVRAAAAGTDPAAELLR